MFSFEGDDANWPLVTCRSETVARLRTGQFERATYLKIPIEGVANCAAEGIPDVPDLERRTYTDLLLQLVADNTAATSDDTTPAATAAVEASVGLISRAFAAAEVSGPSVVVDALSPERLATIARWMLKAGEIVHRIDVRDGMLMLLPAQSHYIEGDADPDT